MERFRKKILENVLCVSIAISGLVCSNEASAMPINSKPGSQPISHRYSPASYPHIKNSNENNEKSNHEFDGVEALGISGTLVGAFGLYLLYCGYQDYKSRKDRAKEE